MTAKHFTCYVRSVGSKSAPWAEEYTKETDNPKQWARDTIARFNDTLRPGEKPRELVRVEVHGDVASPQHHWSKQNLMTLARGDTLYDSMKCTVCGITGKRFRLDAVRRDSKYRAQVYERCDTTVAHLAKKIARESETS